MVMTLHPPPTVTVVTALYAISSKQPIEFYLNMARRLLANLAAHVVLFTSPELYKQTAALVTECRGPDGRWERHVVVQPLDAWHVWRILHLTDLEAQLPQVRALTSWLPRGNISPHLSALWHNKRHFVCAAQAVAPWAGQGVRWWVWCDIGAARCDSWAPHLRTAFTPPAIADVLRVQGGAPDRLILQQVGAMQRGDLMPNARTGLRGTHTLARDVIGGAIQIGTAAAWATWTAAADLTLARLVHAWRATPASRDMPLLFSDEFGAHATLCNIPAAALLLMGGRVRQRVMAAGMRSLITEAKWWAAFALLSGELHPHTAASPLTVLHMPTLRDAEWALHGGEWQAADGSSWGDASAGVTLQERWMCARARDEANGVASCVTMGFDPAPGTAKRLRMWWVSARGAHDTQDVEEWGTFSWRRDAPDAPRTIRGDDLHPLPADVDVRDGEALVRSTLAQRTRTLSGVWSALPVLPCALHSRLQWTPVPWQRAAYPALDALACSSSVEGGRQTASTSSSAMFVAPRPPFSASCPTLSLFADAAWSSVWGEAERVDRTACSPSLQVHSDTGALYVWFDVCDFDVATQCSRRGPRAPVTHSLARVPLTLQLDTGAVSVRASSDTPSAAWHLSARQRVAPPPPQWDALCYVETVGVRRVPGVWEDPDYVPSVLALIASPPPPLHPSPYTRDTPSPSSSVHSMNASDEGGEKKADVEAAAGGGGSSSVAAVAAAAHPQQSTFEGGEGHVDMTSSSNDVGEIELGEEGEGGGVLPTHGITNVTWVSAHLALGIDGDMLTFIHADAQSVSACVRAPPRLTYSVPCALWCEFVRATRSEAAERGRAGRKGAAAPPRPTTADDAAAPPPPTLPSPVWGGRQEAAEEGACPPHTLMERDDVSMYGMPVPLPAAASVAAGAALAAPATDAKRFMTFSLSLSPWACVRIDTQTGRAATFGGGDNDSARRVDDGVEEGAAAAAASVGAQHQVQHQDTSLQQACGRQRRRREGEDSDAGGEGLPPPPSSTTTNPTPPPPPPPRRSSHALPSPFCWRRLEVATPDTYTQAAERVPASWHVVPAHSLEWATHPVTIDEGLAWALCVCHIRMRDGEQRCAYRIVQLELREQEEEEEEESKSRDSSEEASPLTDPLTPQQARARPRPRAWTPTALSAAFKLTSRDAVSRACSMVYAAPWLMISYEMEADEMFVASSTPAELRHALRWFTCRTTTL